MKIPFHSLFCTLGLLLISITAALSSPQISVENQKLQTSVKVDALTPIDAKKIVAEVDRIAEQVTVLINSQTQGNGSGTIVARQGKTYYVLTTGHVVAKPDRYEIITLDGEKHALDYQTITKFEGVDIALLQFTSQNAYAVATLGNYDVGFEDRALVFLSGYPGVKSGMPSRKLTGGTVASQAVTQFLAQTVYSMANGYELIYTSPTQRGMSGAPVFDRLGRVIGINAAAEAEWTISDQGEDFEIQLGRSLGVPMRTFLGAANKGSLDAKLLKVEASNPPNLSEAERNQLLEEFSAPMPEGGANALEWLNWGNLQWRIGKYQEAVNAFERAIELEPDFYQAYYAKGVALYGQEKYRQAIVAFERASLINANIYEIWRLKAVTLQTMKKYPEALTAVEAAIRLNPTDAVLYIYRGTILSDLERYREAKDTYTKAIALNPTYFAYSFRGDAYFQLRDYPKAFADYNKLVELQPNSFMSYLGRGNAYFALGEEKAALADFNKFLELAPAKHKLVPVIYHGRGMLRLNAQDYQGAIADCTKTIESNTDDHTKFLAYQCRARAYAESGEVKLAIAEYGEIIKSQPQNASAYFDRASYRSQAEDYRGALEDFTKAIEIKPDYADAYRNRSTIKTILTDSQGAIEDAKKADELYTQQIDRDPTDINLYTSRAISRVGFGNKEGALQDLDKAEELSHAQGINNTELIQNLRQYIQKYL
jgi:tetratricopeptide (TPR) repeat protein